MFLLMITITIVLSLVGTKPNPFNVLAFEVTEILLCAHYGYRLYF